MRVGSGVPPCVPQKNCLRGKLSCVWRWFERWNVKGCRHGIVYGVNGSWKCTNCAEDFVPLLQWQLSEQLRVTAVAEQQRLADKCEELRQQRDMERELAGRLLDEKSDRPIRRFDDPRLY